MEIVALVVGLIALFLGIHSYVLHGLNRDIWRTHMKEQHGEDI